jgi:hypothetical protein
VAGEATARSAPLGRGRIHATQLFGQGEGAFGFGAVGE